MADTVIPPSIRNQSPTVKFIYLYLLDHGPAHSKEIKDDVYINRGVQRALATLESAGLVQCESRPGDARKSVYETVEQSEQRVEQ